MKKINGLKCKECSKEYPAAALHVCEFCFGPLEVSYNYDFIKTRISKEKILSGPKSLWRYQELLPIEGEPTVGLNAGFTPMIHAKNLGSELGHISKSDFDKMYNLTLEISRLLSGFIKSLG